MHSTLKEIFLSKQKEVEEKKKTISTKQLELSPLFDRATLSLKSALSTKKAIPNIIAEFKRKSPSKGIINETSAVSQVVKGYAEAGAVGISILTDYLYFGGKNEELTEGRHSAPSTPILRKDFILDEFQLLEAKSIGADVILIIAAMVSPSEIRSLSKKANELALEVLLEVHTQEELETSPLDYVDIIGVNNRNLHTFSVSIDTSFELSQFIPKGIPKISESGLKSPESLLRLEQEGGYHGFLIGESFMNTAHPHLQLKSFFDLYQKVFEQQS